MGPHQLTSSGRIIRLNLTEFQINFYLRRLVESVESVFGGKGRAEPPSGRKLIDLFF